MHVTDITTSKAKYQRSTNAPQNHQKVEIQSNTAETNYDLPHLQEIRNGFNCSGLVDPDLIAPHYELLLKRKPVLRQAPQPQAFRHAP